MWTSRCCTMKSVMPTRRPSLKTGRQGTNFYRPMSTAAMPLNKRPGHSKPIFSLSWPVSNPASLDTCGTLSYRRNNSRSISMTKPRSTRAFMHGINTMDHLIMMTRHSDPWVEKYLSTTRLANKNHGTNAAVTASTKVWTLNTTATYQSLIQRQISSSFPTQ